LAEIEASFWRRHRLLTWVVGILLVVLAGLAVAVSIAMHRAEPFLRARIVDALKDRFHARVELDSFHMSLVNGIEAQGGGLRIWPADGDAAGTAGVDQSQPLIRLAEFRFHAPLDYKPGKPVRIGVVQLKGLKIHLPPKSYFHSSIDTSPKDKPMASMAMVSFGVEKIVGDDADLVLETNKPGKLPLNFAIAHFDLTDSARGFITANSVMRFTAALTNPRPVGMIHSTGTIGPWQNADPGETEVAGDYTFGHADLASFKGIAGILSSTGKYQGTLRNLNVDGETDTPDFRLTHFGNSMPLHTQFHANVDATNGDTWLKPVDAVLGKSHFTAQGQVVRVIDTDANGKLTSRGHDIALDIKVNAARIEDFLELTSHNSTKLLTGALSMNAALHIPPGTEPIHQRMTLKGNFVLDDALFTSEKIQHEITQLSMRGQGLPREAKSTDPKSTRSSMRGDFQMANAVVTLPALSYTVPGAEIQLNGTYGMEGGALDFAGVARLDATVSQMVGGVFGALLKPADRFFKKDGAGTEVPIHVAGTREHPEFGVDFGRMKQKTLQPQESP
jgi:hypothetical protein